MASTGIKCLGFQWVIKIFWLSLDSMFKLIAWFKPT